MSNELFYHMLKYNGMGQIKSYLIYQAVSLFGGKYYSKTDEELQDNRMLVRFTWGNR